MRCGKIGTLLLIMILGVIGFAMLGRYSGGEDRTTPQPSQWELHKQRADNAEFERTLQAAIASGAIHSVDPEFGRVRLSADLWLGLSLEDKQKSVLMWSAYFKSLGHTSHVEILSDRNDTKFATYSEWGGCKILY